MRTVTVRVTILNRAAVPALPVRVDLRKKAEERGLFLVRQENISSCRRTRCARASLARAFPSSVRVISAVRRSLGLGVRTMQPALSSLAMTSLADAGRMPSRSVSSRCVMGAPISCSTISTRFWLPLPS